MKILIINGPNLNFLGQRDKDKYGNHTLREINEELMKRAKSHNIILNFFQSNHDGDIIDYLQNESSREANGILINPGALTHYSYSLRDALVDIKLPIVEVHLSDLSNREEFRKIDVLDGIVLKKIPGLKEESYYSGLEFLINYLQKK